MLSLKKPKTVDEIMNSFTKAAQELNDLAVKENEQAIELRGKALTLESEAEEREKEASRAIKLSQKITDFASV